MRGKRLMGLLYLVLLIGSGFSQTSDSVISKRKYPIELPEWIHNMVYDTASSTRPRFLFYPVIGYAPETKWEFGLSGLVVFH